MMQVCRICLRTSGSLIKVGRNIVPRAEDVSNVIMQFYEFLREVLIRKDNELFDKMCRKCLITIRDMYSLLEKCEKSNNILIQMKISSVQVRRLSDDFLNRINVKRPRAESDFELDEIVAPKKLCKTETDEVDDVVDQDEFIEVAVIKENITETSQTPLVSAVSNEKTIEESLTSVADDLADVIEFDICDDENKSDSNEEKTSDQQNLMKKCNLCQKSFTTEYYDQHIAKHIENPNDLFKNITNERTKCPKCPLSYRRFSMLAEHLKLIHGIATTPDCAPIQCDMCPKYYSSLESLIEHRNLHPESEQYGCRICSKEGLKSVDLVKHIQFHLNSALAKNYKCYQCNETFADMSTMIVHEKVIHNKRAHACDYCFNKYTTRVGLQNHIISKHGTDRLVTCPVCNLLLSGKGDLATHMDAFKDGYQCSECPLKFNNQRDFEAHKIYHRSGINRCVDCQMSFHSKLLLQRHEEMHARMPFRCQHCNRYLQTETSYKHHLTQHEDNDATKSNSNAPQHEITSTSTENKATSVPNIAPEKITCANVQVVQIEQIDTTNAMQKKVGIPLSVINTREAETKKKEMPVSDTKNPENMLVISNVRSVNEVKKPISPANVQSNRGLSKDEANEQNEVVLIKTSLGNMILKKRQNVEVKADFGVLDERIITETKQQSSEGKINLIVDSNVKMKPLNQNVIMRKHDVATQIECNRPSNSLPNTVILRNTTNTNINATPTNNFMTTNVQGGPVSAIASIDLTAVDYVCDPSVSIFRTTQPRNQIARKSTTSLLTSLSSGRNVDNSIENVNGDSASSSRARISVRRDLMQTPESLIGCLLQHVPEDSDFAATETSSNSWNC